MDNQSLDIVVYGATGFTGRLVCEYLNRTYGVDGEFRWAMAGRNQEKLLQIRDALNIDKQLPLLVADSEDQASIDAMVGAARVVLSAAGPYQQYGTSVVEACARLGTDYVDLCGEPLWMKAMIEAYHGAAKQSGARIVFSCGFDSLPSDLAVQLLQQRARETLGAPLPRVKCRVKDLRGTASGGTIASFKGTLAAVEAEPELAGVMFNAFALAEGFVGPEQPTAHEKIYEEDLQSWSGPFLMATINTKNVHRSNLLLGHAYGEDFVYDEMVLLGEEAPKETDGGGDFGFDMSLQPGEGPSQAEREAGYYEIWYVGSNAAGDSLKVIVNGDQDPGYGSTSKMIAEAAICLLDCNADGGCLTAAPVMGAALRERLAEYAGVSFEIA